MGNELGLCYNFFMTNQALVRKKQEALDYWYKSSQDEFKTAISLFKLKRYHHSLFFCHLSLEKLLKGKIVEKLNISPLPVHNLVVLAKQLKLDLSVQNKIELREVTAFNLNARYDSYKFDFYKKANLMFTKKWIKIIEKWLERLKNL